MNLKRGSKGHLTVRAGGSHFVVWIVVDFSQLAACWIQELGFHQNQMIALIVSA
jgi:hypothetical protein